jgi:hypothetical protein
MTPQESTMLNDLVRKIEATELPEKDEEAEQFLKQSLAGNPDSLYILAQTVLVQNIALNQAKSQVQQLQQQLQQAQSQIQTPPPAPAQHTSFLGSLLGRHDAPPPPSAQSFPPRPAAAPQYYPPAASYPPPPPYVPDYAAAPPVAPSGGSSFLRSAATTAAGVAAGALAFEGVESILHGFGHGGGGFGGGFGGGGFGGGGFGERPVEETVINNYYDDPNPGFGEHHEREASFDERPGSGFGNDDRGVQLNDASYERPEEPAYSDPQGIDTLDDDQTTGGLDDSSSLDDSGSFDSGDDSSVL